MMQVYTNLQYLMSMFKKKQQKQTPISYNNNQHSHNSHSVVKKPAQMFRMDTESDVLPHSHQQSKTRAEIQQRFDPNNPNNINNVHNYTHNTAQQTVNILSTRHKIKCKQLQKILTEIKNVLQQQLDLLLIGEPVWQNYQIFMLSQLWRVQVKSKQQIMEDLGKIIQALELLYSKLWNNQKVKDILYVKDQSQLLLFFKHLFGKPYTVCNYPSFRKVLNTVWQHQIFKTFNTSKMVDHLKLWCCGVQYPLNPAAIPLHKFVFGNVENIKKYALLLCNSVIYCHINGGDCMGLTPLLVAAHGNRTLAYQSIIKAGANIFCCPMTWRKGQKSSTISKKGNKQVVQIINAISQRKQYNIFQILLTHRQFQQIVNILSLNQVYKLKKMKKNNSQINKKINQIPDCCFQIHWKTYKGFLSFKQLPKDIITVYKKGGSLRIDYHVDDLQQVTSQTRHYSILIKTGKQKQQVQSSSTNPSSTSSSSSFLNKLQYYYIDHNSKKIYNLMREIHSQKLKLRYEQITQLGNIQQQFILSLKSTSKLSQSPQLMDLNAQFYYQNISKAPLYQFKDVNAYQRMLYQSDVVDYAVLQQSEVKCTVKQNLGEIPKVKNKVIKSNCGVKIQWVKEKVNLKHICYILGLLDKKSPLFIKLNQIFDTFLTQQIYQNKYSIKLPLKMTVDLGSDFSLQIQIKNLAYLILDDAVFGLQFRTKTMSYQQQNLDVASLQQTMIMEQNYSINMSRFLGKTQKLLDIQEEQANRMFQELLSRQISGQGQLSDQQEGSSQNQRKDQIGSGNASMGSGSGIGITGGIGGKSQRSERIVRIQDQ